MCWCTRSATISASRTATWRRLRRAWNERLFDELDNILHDRRRRIVDFSDEGRELLALLGLDLQLLFFGVGEKLRILHGGGESRPEHPDAFGRHAGRSDERAVDVVGCIKELDRLPLPGRAREIAYEWHARKRGIVQFAAAQQDEHRFVGNPVRTAERDAGEALAKSVDFPVLHGGRPRRGGREAGDDLELE